MNDLTGTAKFIIAPNVAKMLGVKTATLAAWRKRGTGPKGSFPLSGTCIAYPAADVAAWIEDRKALTVERKPA